MRTFLVLDLGLDVLDGVAALDLERDRLPRQRLDEDLHLACLDCSLSLRSLIDRSRWVVVWWCLVLSNEERRGREVHFIGSEW